MLALFSAIFRRLRLSPVRALKHSIADNQQRTIATYRSPFRVEQLLQAVDSLTRKWEIDFSWFKYDVITDSFHALHSLSARARRQVADREPTLRKALTQKQTLECIV